MIYERADIWNNFSKSNRKGQANDVLLALGNLIRDDKESVIEAFRMAKIPFPKDAENEVIAKKIVGYLRMNTPNSRALLNNLSVLVYADQHRFLNSTGDKQGSLWERLFKKTDRPDGTKGSKAGDFLRQNKESILDIAGNLIEGVNRTGAATTIANQSFTDFEQKVQEIERQNAEREAQLRRQYTTNMIIVGVLVIGAGIGAYYYFKKK